MGTKFQPLAIVGMSCRFPGGLETIAQLEQGLKSRYCAIDKVPSDRWDVDRYYSSDNTAKGKTYMHRGGFLKQDISKFDAAFFGISPRDADAMDPQQRLLLEVVWEAFENAGLSAPEHAGRSVGVYVGGFMLDHMLNQMAFPNRSKISQSTAAGMMMTMLSNRVSHTFDFRGPSLSIDTACSSSLVAFHYGCQDLWRGESEMAVVGGANVMLRADYPNGMCKGQFLSRDGECKSFDERGDGYGRGEGAGIVLIKHLDDALANGDQVLATVLATGTNQDGRTPGASMPSGEAQANLIRSVSEKYGINMRDVRYIECHGTGTAIGDPTEAGAIGQTYGAANRDNGPVTIGSIKSNIGHLEACAGVAGVIKAVLTLQNQGSAPLANLGTPNPKIDLEKLNLRLSDDQVKLAEPGEEFSVAVNSFGYGGSNAHAVLRSSPTAAGSNGFSVSQPHTNGVLKQEPVRPFPYFLPLSGRNEKALEGLAERYAELLRSDAPLEDVLHCASFKRAHLSHRAVIFGSNRTELAESLQRFASGEECQNVVVGNEPFQGLRKPALVFTGMGPQWWAMGQELYREVPRYREVVEAADRVFEEIAGFSILAEMLKEEEPSCITKTEFAQPANFILQIGIWEVLKEAGVEPGAIVGHSVGEVASAYVAGALSLYDAMLVSYHRSQLQGQCKGTGSMLAVGCSMDEALELIEPSEGRVSIAAINGPNNLTLAGDSDALADIAMGLADREVFHRMLEVEVPYHSPMMDPILDSLATALSELRPTEPTIPLYSTVSGKQVTGVEYGADYWQRNVREPVHFAGTIRAMLDDGYNTFIEIGPHPVLATSLKECFKEAGVDARQAFTLRRNQPEVETLMRSICSVHAFGCEFDWERHNSEGEFITLPNYAWQREHFWNENDRAVQDRIAEVKDPILGIQEAPATYAWRNDFDHEVVSYLRDHVVDGMPILPAAAYIESLLELASLQFAEAKGIAIHGLKIDAPMIITPDRGLDCVTTYDPFSRITRIRSLENGRLGPGQDHLSARLSPLAEFQMRKESIDSLQAQCPTEHSVPAFYDNLSRVGLQYGPAFQTIRELHSSAESGMALCRLELESSLEHDIEKYCLHPTLLDACFQSLFALVTDSKTTYLPTGIGELCLYANSCGTEVWCLSQRRHQSAQTIECDLTLMDSTGRVLASIRSMQLSAAGARPLVDQYGDPVKQQILRYDWRYGEEIGEPKRLGHWAIVDRQTGLSDLIAGRMADFGAVLSTRLRVDADESESEVTRISHLDQASIQSALAAAGELDGVVFMNGLHFSEENNDPTGETSIAEISSVLKALDASEAQRKPRVYVVTKSAFNTQESDPEVAPDQTAINGFSRVAFNELEGLQVSTIDLPAFIDDEIVESLVRELLADDLHDEVALRSSFRFVSELLETPALHEDQIDYRSLDDEHPIQVRPVHPDTESIGTIRVIEAPTRSIAANEVRLNIEASTVPIELFTGNVDLSKLPILEVVARVLEVGEDVHDLSPGNRVAGFAKIDMASHAYVARDQIYVTHIGEEEDAVALVSCLRVTTLSELATDRLALNRGEKVAVQSGVLGDAIAGALMRRGVLPIQFAASETASYDPSVYSLCPEGIASALEEVTGGRGFAALVASMSSWDQHLGLRLVRDGGAVLDTDSEPGPLKLEAHLATALRNDLASAMQLPAEFQSAIETAIKCIVEGKSSTVNYLDVSVADLAWKRLPLEDTNTTLIITYDCQGRDLPVVKTHSLAFDENATYLITGGFGGLGRKTAEWLVGNGARHLAITGRSGANSEEKQAFVRQLGEQGVTVRPLACDTADFERLSEVFQELSAEMPPLKGVFHSGAVIHDQPIAEMELEVLQQVMRSKALGAWNLHRLTEAMDLDHFVLYSSVANAVGNSRQAAYSAANGFLNGLAEHRNAHNLPATAVSWGAIADVGVVARDEKLEQFLKYTGLRGIQSDEGLAVLKEALARQVTQFGVTLITSWVDWSRFETRGAKSPRFATLIAADSVDDDNSARDALVEELSQLSPPDRVELLSSLMVEILASVLRSDPSTVPIDCAINQFGVDSLMATEVQMLFDSKLGINVSVLQLIGDTTIRELAANSIENLMGENTGAPATSSAE